jgi:hypothetical protein
MFGDLGDAVLSKFYTSTEEEIHSGDRINLDGRFGLVEIVCKPNSDVAETYACFASGGLLILFDDGVLELIPFGYFHHIMRESQK